MSQITIHNPDSYMVDLRRILSQGRKRIGLLIGAGAPVSLKVDAEGELDDDGDPLIPDVERLTQTVLDDLLSNDREVINNLLPELGEKPNIEMILTRIRQLSQAIGNATIYDLNGAGYAALATRICQQIGKIVAPSLPEGPNSFTDLVSWVGGALRDHPIEIFTTNYDLLLEEAFERARLPYFDGFTGAYRPFFDPTSISDDLLPSRWSRIWKMHGSLGWDLSGETIIRTGSREAAMLIYPDHLKYDQITQQPYSALFERLRTFLMTPDSLLLCSGFSFSDPQITSVLDYALAANTHTAVLAFQFRPLDDEEAASGLARRRPNLSVYARDGAVIFGIPGKWHPGQPPSDDWESIRSTFWEIGPADEEGEFLLGDFAMLARFFALAQVNTFTPPAEMAWPTIGKGEEVETLHPASMVSRAEDGDV